MGMRKYCKMTGIRVFYFFLCAAVFVDRINTAPTSTSSRKQWTYSGIHRYVGNCGLPSRAFFGSVSSSGATPQDLFDMSCRPQPNSELLPATCYMLAYKLVLLCPMYSSMKQSHPGFDTSMEQKYLIYVTESGEPERFCPDLRNGFSTDRNKKMITYTKIEDQASCINQCSGVMQPICQSYAFLSSVAEPLLSNPLDNPPFPELQIHKESQGPQDTNSEPSGATGNKEPKNQQTSPWEGNHTSESIQPNVENDGNDGNTETDDENGVDRNGDIAPNTNEAPENEEKSSEKTALTSNPGETPTRLTKPTNNLDNVVDHNNPNFSPPENADTNPNNPNLSPPENAGTNLNNPNLSPPENAGTNLNNPNFSPPENAGANRGNSDILGPDNTSNNRDENPNPAGTDVDNSNPNQPEENHDLDENREVSDFDRPEGGKLGNEEGLGETGGRPNFESDYGDSSESEGSELVPNGNFGFRGSDFANEDEKDKIPQVPMPQGNQGALNVEPLVPQNQGQLPNPAVQHVVTFDDENEDSSSHFLAYSLTAIILILATYILYHNKQKIIAVVIEGRDGKGRRKRGGGPAYQKLDQNVSEAMPTLNNQTF